MVVCQSLKFCLGMARLHDKVYALLRIMIVSMNLGTHIRKAMHEGTNISSRT